MEGSIREPGDAALSRLGRILGRAAFAVVGVTVLAATVAILHHRRGVARADEEFRTHRPPPLWHLGTRRTGTHDSSDEAIGWFRDAFGAAYRDLEVGAPIRVAP